MTTLFNASKDARKPRSRYLAVKVALAATIAGGALLWQQSANSAEDARAIPAPLQDESAGSRHTETAVLSGGCFWGVQGVFQHLRGVSKVVSGYSGGAASTAQYETVSSGTTGHAESVQITFDPTQISYGQVLQVFFSVAHNPTELNRQGPDHGTQYRSAIFPQSPEQRIVAQAYIQQLNNAHAFAQPIVTSVENFKGFYAAEGYHQNYLTLHPDNPYIAINDLPKIDYLKQYFPKRFMSSPVLLQVASQP